eukprot:Polyplicarium_translucidae@DN2943_c0_g1_i1.p1
MRGRRGGGGTGQAPSRAERFWQCVSVLCPMQSRPALLLVLLFACAVTTALWGLGRGRGLVWVHSPKLSPSLAILTTIRRWKLPPRYLGAPPVPVQILRCRDKKSKQRCVMPLLKKMDPETVVILADSDVLYSNWTVERVIDAFDSLQTEIVVGGERCGFPLRITSPHRPGMTVSEDNSPNAGFIMGRVRHLVPMLEYALAKYSVKFDQGYIQSYWLDAESGGPNVTIDIGRKLVTTMSDWAFWHTAEHPEEGARCPVPWYFADACGRTKKDWIIRPDTVQCVNTDFHRVCLNPLPLCADAYDITGCRVAQRQISRGPVSEEALRRTREGDWAEELWDFLPGRESFAYHGNFGSRTMFREMLERLEKNCPPPASYRMSQLSLFAASPLWSPW